MEHGSERVEFRPPEGFKPPENVEAGKDFDMVCSFRVKPDGDICMTKLGDIDMPGYGSKEEKHEEKYENKPAYGQDSQNMASAMTAGGMGGGY